MQLFELQYSQRHLMGMLRKHHLIINSFCGGKENASQNFYTRYVLKKDPCKRSFAGIFNWWPRRESNLDLELRKLLYYPLYYKAGWQK